ncbi:MAG: lipocalin family protein [Bacteroidales bacterium]|nr:lipocalin family protein [Bacteroidales bacterium]MDD3664911.1 lipocalin family protein [Bacteroidales bacterium]
MRSQFTFLSITCLMLGVGCQTGMEPVTTVNEVDLMRYSGRWYEIARYPNRFQKNCFCSTADYTLSADGVVEVVNSCRKNAPNGPLRSIKGKAFTVEGWNNARLKVQFFWPIKAPYWIVALDNNYQWAVVSGPSRRYLWILAREQQPADSTIRRVLDWMEQNSFPVDKLIFNPTSCAD